MLANLHVKNLALIRECEVEFSSGLNILTGETGAGKSLLLGSVQLILGGKMSREMIRENADYALVELTFTVDDPRVEQRLKELDIYPEEGQLTLSRRIMNNRSISRINGETCTVAIMKQVSSFLLDIHGQHEHQSLLYKNKQLEILDVYGKEKILPIKEELFSLYREYSHIKKALMENTTDEEQRKREISFLEFEIDEIENAGLTLGEDEELEARYRRLNNSKKIAEALGQAHGYSGYDGPSQAGELIGQALHLVNSVAEYDEDISSLESMLVDIDGLLNDFNRDLSAYLESLTFEAEDFHKVEKRLDEINNLKGKYGDSIEKIWQYLEKQKEKLEYYRKYEENQERLHQEKNELEKQLQIVCGSLTSMRREYAGQLEQVITEELRELNFLDVKFRIHFTELKDYTANGLDDVEYLISTNPGEPLKPLNKVVSGGELSRIMLAIKTLLADRDEVGTLIFDEIDTGISGRTAQKVSEKMARIGEKKQVLCITHLPQIASMADTHFLISKTVKDNQTITSITCLEGEESTRELARMLGGAQITQAVLENAREMKLLAQKQKNTRLHS